jgi:hypothetical protein
VSERPYTGGCLCGAVRFAVDGPIERCVHCHCSMCRRNHGAGFVTWLVVPRSRFRLEDGQQALQRYASSEGGSRSFCGTCGSSMFCELEAHPDVIDVVLGCLDDPGDLTPQLHVFWSDRARWLQHADHLPKLGGKTGVEPL